MSLTRAPQVSAAFGGSLNILVNNAGTNIRKPTVEYSEQVRASVTVMCVDSSSTAAPA